MASTRYPRSRTGCWVCRFRKKKCDEARPACQQCQKLKIQCHEYGAAQPVWMRDPEAAKRKKDEIKLQIGKRGRRRRKPRPAQDLESGATMQQQQQQQQHNDSENRTVTLLEVTAMRASENSDDSEGRTGGTQPFIFETIKGGIRLLKSFNENPEKSSSQAITMLDSPRLPIVCFRCPTKNSPSRIACPEPGYGLLDARTGKLLPRDIEPGVVLVTAREPTKSTVPNTRTKEEEIDNDEYDVLLASFTSTSKNQPPFGSSAVTDPLITPSVNLHELNLIRNYIRNVFRLAYCGMSEARIHKSLREVVVPLLRTNPGLVKGCMSISAIHLAISSGGSGPHFRDDLLNDSWENGIKCVQDLHKRLADEGASEQTLALILTITSFEAPSPLSNWKFHLQGAIECFISLDLINRPTHSAITKFLMSRVIWLDILSALTLGRAPQLWANYREILSRPVHERSYCGLLEMMGCDDTVMFLVSEVMCIEDYKFRTLDDGMISWARGRKRAMELDIRLRDRDLPVSVKLPPSPEPPLPSLDEGRDSGNGANGYLVSLLPPSPTMSDPQSPATGESNQLNPHHPPPTPSSPALAVVPLSPPVTAEGTNSSERTALKADCSNNHHHIPPGLPSGQGMIVKATTAAFRTATRIHLWSIGLGFYPHLSFFKQLLEELMVMVALIPVGLSRTVAWPLLVGGCIAIEPRDRDYFASRCTMGGIGGSLCEIAKVMREVWRRSDESDRKLGVGCGQEVHWRSVMRDQGMEILLV